MYKSMATKKRGLGQGIDSLIPNKVNANKETETVKVNAGSEKNETDGIFVNINKVEPNREQPRKNFDEDSLVDLSESIKQVGVLQPLLVLDKKDYYEIIAGERRWRAAKLAGLKEVPVRIMNLTDQEVVEISLVENIQRENLNPIEEAFAYKRLLTEFHLKQDEVAERVSKSRTAVTNSMRLLKLDERVQQMVIDDMITTGHARALLGIEDVEKQFATAQKIFDENLSVRETEKLVKKIQNNKDIPVEKKKEINGVSRLGWLMAIIILKYRKQTEDILVRRKHRVLFPEFIVRNMFVVLAKIMRRSLPEVLLSILTCCVWQKYI